MNIITVKKKYLLSLLLFFTKIEASDTINLLDDLQVIFDQFLSNQKSLPLLSELVRFHNHNLFYTKQLDFLETKKKSYNSPLDASTKTASFKNYFIILNVPYTASTKDIENKYNTLKIKNELIPEIEEAYNVLVNDEKKEKYFQNSIDQLLNDCIEETKKDLFQNKQEIFLSLYSNKNICGFMLIVASIKAPHLRAFLHSSEFDPEFFIKKANNVTDLKEMMKEFFEYTSYILGSLSNEEKTKYKEWLKQQKQ